MKVKIIQEPQYLILGVDACTRDDSVLLVTNYTDGSIVHKEVIPHKEVPDDRNLIEEISRAIFRLVERFKIRTVIIDPVGIGAVIADVVDKEINGENATAINRGYPSR